MQRKSKFRGRRKDNGKWIHGSYVYISYPGVECHLITTLGGLNFEVDEKTVGQYLGQEDNVGVEIYEKDILKTNEAGWIGKVVYYNARYILVDNQGGFATEPEWGKCKIIGDTFQHGHLMEGK